MNAYLLKSLSFCACGENNICSEEKGWDQEYILHSCHSFIWLKMTSYFSYVQLTVKQFFFYWIFIYWIVRIAVALISVFPLFALLPFLSLSVLLFSLLLMLMIISNLICIQITSPGGTPIRGKNAGYKKNLLILLFSPPRPPPSPCPPPPVTSVCPISLSTGSAVTTFFRSVCGLGRDGDKYTLASDDVVEWTTDLTLTVHPPMILPLSTRSNSRPAKCQRLGVPMQCANCTHTSQLPNSDSFDISQMKCRYTLVTWIAFFQYELVWATKQMR